MLYSAEVVVEGGRDGQARSSDGKLEIAIAPPEELGGNGAGTNPEQLFAAGFAACFLSAIGAVARGRKQTTGQLSAESRVALMKHDDGAFRLGLALTVLCGEAKLERVRELAEEAKRVCPYSRAVAGNIEVDITVETK